MSDYNRSFEPPDVPVPPDFSHLDSVEDIIRDATQWGMLEQLRERLSVEKADERQHIHRAIRDIAFELAGAKNRALAVDVFLHATGIAEFATCGLRDYAATHGCSHEWFRQQVLGMCERLQLDLPASFKQEFDDAA